MKKQWMVFAIFLFAAIVVRSQYVVKDARELENLRKLPQEKVFVHHTGPLVFTGEYLKYAFYCFNTQSNKFSDISKVGYVALVNEKGQYLVEQKIPLDEGLAQGDFFINTDVPSGNYKLLGYTQWMKNNGLEQIFKTDLVVINPYQVDQDGLRPKDSEDLTPKGPMSITNQVMDSTTVEIRFDKSVFSPREKVKMTLKNYKGILGKGNYTIRIQRKSPFPVTPSQNAMEFGPAYLSVGKVIDKNVGDAIFLPEQQGELYFGKAMDTENGSVIENEEVVISIPGERNFLKSVTTDKNGQFYVYVDKDYKIPLAIFQTKGQQQVKLEFETPEKLDVSELQFGSFELKPDYADVIKRRSVHNQVENQFFSIKPDSVVVEKISILVDRPDFKTFHLDDYTRFPTLQETMVEILSYVGFRNNGNGLDYIHVTQFSEDYREDFVQSPAIVLLDGVYIPNHEILKDFDARVIKNILVSQEKFNLGDTTYQGMVRLETIDGDYYATYEPLTGIKVPIQMPQPQKNYFKQQYAPGDTSFANIPDYRELLFWEPHLEVGVTDMQMEFYTSDLKGEFEVILDGFTSYGKPIYAKSSIVVK